jgi:hypothetical protein
MIKFLCDSYTRWFRTKINKTNKSSDILLTFRYDITKEQIYCSLNTVGYNNSENIIENCEKIGFFISSITYKNNMLKNLVKEAILDLKTDETTTLYYDNILFFWGQYDHIQYDKLHEPMISPTKVFKMYAETNDLL